MKKGIFEKSMSGLETRDFIVLRTSCSIEKFVFMKLAERNPREIFLERTCKVNIIFSIKYFDLRDSSPNS